MVSPLPSPAHVYPAPLQQERPRQVKTGSEFHNKTAFSMPTPTTIRLNLLRKGRQGRNHSFSFSMITAKGPVILLISATDHMVIVGPASKEGRTRPLRSQKFLRRSKSHVESSSSTPLLPCLNQKQPKQLLQFLSNLTGCNE